MGQINKVLFIPGMFSQAVGLVMGTYFADQQKYLADRDIPFEVIKINTERTSEHNRGIIRDAIRAQDEKVVIYAHSKGGVDLLETLIHYPELKPRITKVICLQSPFHGTPLAELVDSNPISRTAVKLAQKVFTGKYDSLLELKEDSRIEYMTKHRATISAIVKSMEFVCIGTTVSNNIGLKNDGLVPMHSALIEGAKNITLNNLDHASAVLSRTITRFDRKKFFNSLLVENFSRGTSEFQVA